VVPRSHNAQSENGLHKQFGARIRYLRLKLGLSQEELAGLCNLDRTYLGGIERGERNPSLKNISLIATALRVPIAALFDDPNQARGKAK
jgi:transcriptional regulator with XRE-family HTH domain